MLLTSLWGHMESESPLLKKQLVHPGDLIGRMGSTGKSTARHCHLGLIHGERVSVFQMKDVILTDDIIQQLGYFVCDHMIFKVKTEITAYIGDPYYFELLGIIHKGYDIVPINRHTHPGKNFNMYWPRTKIGKVMGKGFHQGYGYYVLISFAI